MIPEFYARNEKGIPAAWVARIRESMARLTPRFAASRAVREYTEQHYLPSAAEYRARAADKGSRAKELADAKDALATRWASLRFGARTVETKREGTSLGRRPSWPISARMGSRLSSMPTECSAAPPSDWR